MEPIRVLHVLGTLNLGGAESRVMDLYRNMDHKQVQFDFLIHSSGSQHYEEEVKKLGGRIYRLPRFKGYNFFSYKRALKNFFQNHPEIKAVHGHMTSTAVIYLPLAKKQGISMTIAHARSAGVDLGIKGKITLFLRRKLKEKTDYCFTCSALAGEAVFGKRAMNEGRVQVIPNAIQVGKYEFSTAIREKIRKELGLEDKLILGHVGRFSFMKNHKFLLAIFCEVLKKQENTVLLLLGEGEGKKEIEELAKENKIKDKVIFAGNRKNVWDYYQAMDYFVFPSFFEGFPGTVLEAQAAALPCLISDRITKEVAVTSLVAQYSLEKSAAEWADVIINHLKEAQRCGKNQVELREKRKLSVQEKIKTAGFDVKTQAKEMLSFYQTAEKKKLLLLVPMLHQGGFERVCVLTAKIMKKNYQVFLGVFDLTDQAYDIEGIPVFHLDLGVKKGKLAKAINVIKRCQKVAELKKKMEIDVTYSFGPTANLVNVLSGRGKQGKNWCGVRSYMDLNHKNHKTMQLFTKRADKIVSCSKVIEEELRQQYQVKDITTLYNPYDKASILQQSLEEITGPGEKEEAVYEGGKVPCKTGDFLKKTKKKYTLASMGREDDIKGFWHLLKAFSLVAQEKEEARLVIIGEGEFLEYKKLAKQLEIEERVCFTGLKKNPYPYLKRAGIYVLTSYHEGFPNALVEAMSLGIPVIATDCKTGPSEILENKYGILIPNMSPKKNMDAKIIEEDEKELARSILRLWEQEEEYNHYAKMAEIRSGHFTFEAYEQQFCKMMEGN